jgi:hypothetical protein
MQPFSYVVIQTNNPNWGRESALLRNDYNPKKKYVFIQKSTNSDGSENTNFIDYSNDLEILQKAASKFKSWYNYPIGLYKGIDGVIHELN